MFFLSSFYLCALGKARKIKPGRVFTVLLTTINIWWGEGINTSWTSTKPIVKMFTSTCFVKCNYLTVNAPGL